MGAALLETSMAVAEAVASLSASAFTVFDILYIRV